MDPEHLNPSSDGVPPVGESNNATGSDAQQHLLRLRPEALAALHASVEDRVRLCREDKFILYTDAKNALSKLKDLLSWPCCERPPGYLLSAPCDYGKTALVNRMLRDLGGDAAVKPGVHDIIQLLVLSLCSRPTDVRIAMVIARVLKMPVFAGRESREIGDIVLREVKKRGIRVMVLQEFNNLAALPKNELEVAFDFIKDLTNLGISIVAVGTEISVNLVANDEEIASRLRPIRLGGFAPDQEFVDFLATLETFYPLPEASTLPNFAEEVYRRTRGVIGDVVRLTNDAAVWSIRNNRRCIASDAFVASAFVDRLRENPEK